ncbi:MAG: hypothetical protein IJB79_08445 [Candidatus Gastranaerophilales bacterium]|nr:hypothetical protein [Candidatus Gastranaerophilales bacterium]
MKKLFIISMLLMFGFVSYAEARVQYDSTGRTIVNDNTIRGRRRAAEANAEIQRKLDAAAAAKMDYEQALKSLETPKPKTNFYQDRIKETEF